MTAAPHGTAESMLACVFVPVGVNRCRPVSAAPGDFLMTDDDALPRRCAVVTTTVGWVPNQTCGSLPPFEPGPKLNDAARCERIDGHPGPHCWRGPAQRCTMWSDDEPIVSPSGVSLVSLDDLMDDDGTVWR
jgi:hypothetical protein